MVESAAERLCETRITQPALFVIEYALAMQWIDWGIRPQAMIGHSIGEYVAACISGVMLLEDALALIAARGRMIQGLEAGAMLAVPFSEFALRELLDPGLSIAAVNAPGLTVVSGPKPAIDAFEQKLNARGAECRRLHTSHAFHSAMMDPVLDAFVDRVRRIRLSPPNIPFISNVSGKWITPLQATDPRYWANHIRATVRFADGMAEILRQPDRVLLEVGPGHTLASLARPVVRKDMGHGAFASLRGANEAKADRQTILTAIAGLWTAGLTVNWTKLKGEARRRRIPAPTYPFERRRYWVEPILGGAAVAAKPELQKKAEIADWFYFPGWRRVPSARLLPRAEPMGSPWLVFRGESDFAVDLVAALRQRGDKVIEVISGAQFTSTGRDLLTIDPAQPTDYVRLLNHLVTQGEIPQRMVHTWNVTGGPSESGFSDRAQYLGVYSLMFFVQAMQSAQSDPIQIFVFSDGIQEISGAESIQASKATTLAPCIVIPQEHPNITCRSIDIDTRYSSEQRGRLIRDAIAEMEMGRGPMFTGLRNGHRWVQTFEPASFPAVQNSPAVLRRNGVYLITGGLGNIGLTIAEYLARTVQGKLVLVGRTALPPREEWDKYLRTTEPGDPVNSRIHRIRAIEALGAEVMAFGGDVADAPRMREFVDETEQAFGPINGVFHSAGILSGRGFAEIGATSESLCEMHFGPKARGVLVLDEIFRDRPVDFVLLMSSIASALGGLGYMAYTAGNLFLDAFARSKRLAGDGRWRAVNWDAWTFDSAAPLEGRGLAALTMDAREGIDALERILTADDPGQIVVSTADLELRLQQWVAPEQRETKAQTQLESHPRPAVSSTWAGPRHDVDRVVAGIWETLLGVERIGIHDNFFELGGHSLLVTQVLSRLRDNFRVNIPLRQLFESPTIAQLSDFLISMDSKPGRAEKIAKALILVQGMSSEEVNQALQRKGAAAR
jgi:acyl transferase domain-containing protein/acyl carrier protein